jgi:hypothetical protein
MQAINAAPWFRELLADHRPPCISIYQPVRRSAAPDNQTPVLLRDDLDEVRAMFGPDTGYGGEWAEAAIARLSSVVHDDSLWEGPRDALAIFASPEYSRVVEIRRPVERAVIVADSFHVKPLIRTLQQSRRFHVLCVAPGSVRLFEGDPLGLTEVQLRNVPRSVDDAMATASTGPDFVDDHGPRDAQAEQRYAPPGRVGIERFFRLVDEGVRDHYSHVEQIPCVVCADVQYLSDFLAAAKNEYVVTEGIPLNPHGVTPDRLREEAWRILEPRFEQQIQALKDAYQVAKARHLGSDEVPEVAEAAAVGRVGTLLVDSDAKLPGILHRDSGLIEQARLSNPRADDILDDLAEMVLRTDGQVFVLPHNQMPTDHGAAAVYRY